MRKNGFYQYKTTPFDGKKMGVRWVGQMLVGIHKDKLDKALNGPYVYNGVDRVDNERGYSLENCVPCCKFCNRMKRDLGKKEFLEHIKNIYNEQVIWEEE